MWKRNLRKRTVTQYSIKQKEKYTDLFHSKQYFKETNNSMFDLI